LAGQDTFLGGFLFGGILMAPTPDYVREYLSEIQTQLEGYETVSHVESSEMEMAQ